MQSMFLDAGQWAKLSCGDEEEDLELLEEIDGGSSTDL